MAPARKPTRATSPRLVAGEREAVSHVVRGIMRSAHRCEADCEQDNHPKYERREALRKQRGR